MILFNEEQSALDIKTHKELGRTKVRASAFDSGTKKVSKLGYDIISNKVSKILMACHYLNIELYAGRKGRNNYIFHAYKCIISQKIWEFLRELFRNRKDSEICEVCSGVKVCQHLCE